MQKFFRRTLAALLIVSCLLIAAIVGAAIQTFDGVGYWHTSDAETSEMAMARAKQRAELDAKKKAGVAIKSISQSINSELADDAVSAVTNNIIELVGEVHYDKKFIPLNDQQTTILYTATLKARIDTDGVYDWFKRDEKEKVTIIQQNDNLQDAIAKNDKLAESLTEQYNRATSQAEKDRLRKQMNDAERDFLANQKFEEGNKLAYAKNYSGAIKFYNEVLKFGEYENAYYNRGNAYGKLGQYERTIQDYSKALELNPNLYQAYHNRGEAYRRLKQYEQAIQDFNKAIKLNPYFAESYNNRGGAYDDMGHYDSAIYDLTKAIELKPNDAEIYLNRGTVYMHLKQCESAIKDYNKAIELNGNYSEAYFRRSIAYGMLEKFEQALADATKAIQLNPNYAAVYYIRGVYYQELGDETKAQADFAKAKELGYNG